MKIFKINLEGIQRHSTYIRCHIFICTKIKKIHYTIKFIEAKKSFGIKEKEKHVLNIKLRDH